MNAVSGWRSLLSAASGGSGFVLDDLDATMTLIADLVPGAAACSITELADGCYRTTATSSPLALELDLVQYDSGTGPCMTAARDRQRQQVPDTTTAVRFAEFASAAARRDIHSSLSVPIGSAERLSALNIYSRDVRGFDERGRAVADLAGRVLSACLTGSSPPAPMSTAETARVTRRRALMRAALAPAIAAGATPTAAFESLVRRSSDERRSIFDIATEIVDARGDST